MFVEEKTKYTKQTKNNTHEKINLKSNISHICFIHFN